MHRFSDFLDDSRLLEAVEQAQSLAKSLPQSHDMLKLYQAAIDDIASRELDDDDLPETSYSYIPLDLNEFVASIMQLEQQLMVDVDYRHADLKHRPCAFVEVGCGPGRNVHLLSRTDRFCFDKIHGFDISERMIAAGKARYGMGDDLFVADCLTFDFSGYDVVYFYRPLSDEAAEKQFEAHLVDTLKTGAFVIGAGHVSLDGNRRMIPKGESGWIYKKV